MENVINNFLNTKSEKRSIDNTGCDYEFNYDGHCIKIFVPDSEATDNIQAKLKNLVIKSVINHYQ